MRMALILRALAWLIRKEYRDLDDEGRAILRDIDAELEKEKADAEIGKGAAG